MKKLLIMFCVIAVLLSFAACSNTSGGKRNINASTSETAATDESRQTESKTEPEPSITEEEKNMLNIEIVVGNQTFSATLYDNETARALIARLPMTLNMSELNGNEKYYYLESNLPTNAGRPSSGIHTGDIMLYGSNCLVLFYDSFSTSYSYTPLGRTDNPDGLAAALGKGSIQVTFRIS